MMEKNNFDGWSLLAVGEEAIVELTAQQQQSNGRTSVASTVAAMDEIENEINLVEVEEDQVQRTREKWILVARGKELWEPDNDWTPLVQGSEMAEDNVYNDLGKLKTWAHELKISSARSGEKDDGNDDDFGSLSHLLSNREAERGAWDKRCLPIQIDEFVSIQEKYQFTFHDRKGRVKVLKRHAYDVDDDDDDDFADSDDEESNIRRRRRSSMMSRIGDDMLLKKHSMFFVENTMRDLQDYQLRMRGLLMKMY